MFFLIYFETEREREREHGKGAEREGEGESQAGSALSARSLAQGLIPRTMRS